MRHFRPHRGESRVFFGGFLTNSDAVHMAEVPRLGIWQPQQPRHPSFSSQLNRPLAVPGTWQQAVTTLNEKSMIRYGIKSLAWCGISSGACGLRGVVQWLDGWNGPIFHDYNYILSSGLHQCQLRCARTLLPTPWFCRAS